MQLLRGVRIIECSMLAGAASSTPLADLGAGVITVKPPTGDYVREMTWPIIEGVSLMHLHVTGGKHSTTLDLRSESGVDTFLELVTAADVVVEAMRPGGLARRGLGFDHLRVADPRMGMCTISGYGMTGLYKDLPSHGIAHDAWAGIIRPGRTPDGFPYIPGACLDRHECRTALRRARHPRRHHARTHDLRRLPPRGRAIRRRRRVRLS